MELIFDSLKGDLIPESLRLSFDTLYVGDSISNPLSDYIHYYNSFKKRGNDIDSLEMGINGTTAFNLIDNYERKIKVFTIRTIEEYKIATEKDKYCFILTFSHVSFNNEENEAILEVYAYIQFKRAYYYAVYLKKINNKWTLLDYYIPFIR